MFKSNSTINEEAGEDNILMPGPAIARVMGDLNRRNDVVRRFSFQASSLLHDSRSHEQVIVLDSRTYLASLALTHQVFTTIQT